LNLSCPNIKNHRIIAYDFETFELYLNKIQNLNGNLIFGLKLPPYYENIHFDQVSGLLSKYDKIKYITCCNSIVNGLVIDPDKESKVIVPNNGFGGVGGIPIKPVGLANVHNFYNRLNDKIDIVGCGGISSGTDIFEYVLAGASAVQIGTQLIKEGPECFDRLNSELTTILNKKKYTKLDDFKGNLKSYF
jgi:dihydroorotate dehydrogenase (fumarate)